MRLLRMTTVPASYSAQLYEKHPDLAHLSVTEQIATVFADHFAQGDSYSDALSKRGYECHEAIVNIEPVLRLWAGRAWRTAPLRQHAQRFALSVVQQVRPEILWLNDFTLFDKSWIEAAREASPKRMLVYSWCAVEPRALAELSGPDCILTSSLHLARRFRTSGLRVAVVPFAFDPRVLSRLSSIGRAKEGLSFVGTVRRIDGFHATRARIIEAVADALPISVYSSSKAANAFRRTASRAASGLCSAGRAIGFELREQHRGPLLDKVLRLAGEHQFADNHPVWRSVRPPVFGVEMFQVIADSLVTLNVHAECAGEMTGNIRLFEATGVGTCLLTDARDNITEFFEPNTEIVTFSSPAECVERAKWLLDNPRDALRIGKVGQAKTLSDHTYDHRAEIFDSLFRSDSALQW